MSPLFIKEFKKDNRCRQCAKRPAKRRRFCGAHLTQAREMFMLWSLLRRRRNVCSYCPRPTALPGTLRCGVHRTYNKKKCRAWFARHPEAIGRARDVQRERLAAARALGDGRSRRQILQDRGTARRGRRTRLLVALSAKYPNIVARQG